MRKKSTYVILFVCIYLSGTVDMYKYWHCYVYATTTTANKNNNYYYKISIINKQNLYSKMLVRCN